MPLLKAKIPKAELQVEMDVDKDAFISLNGKMYPIDGAVSELVMSMLEEIVSLREQISVYNEYLGEGGDA